MTALLEAADLTRTYGSGDAPAPVMAGLAFRYRI